MGKKNKKSSYDKKDFLGKYKANNEMAEAYGIDSSQYLTRHGQVRPGGSTTKKSFEQYEKDIANAAANDYDVRRSLEAAKLSGNKKAQKIESVSDLSSAYAASKFMKKTHKNRMENGGAYDGASDQAGVTDYWVNKERSKQNAQFATKEDLSALQKQQAEAVQQAPAEEPYQPSEELVQAKERVQAWEQDEQTSNSPYGARQSSSSSAYGSALKQAQQGGSVDTDVDSFTQKVADRKNNQQGAQNFADRFKKDVKIGANFQPVL